MALLRVVVDGVVIGRRRLDAAAVLQVIAGQVIIVARGRPAIFDARLHRVVAAAVDAGRAAGREAAALGLDIDHAGCAQPVLRRQGAGDQLDRTGEPCAEALAEEADAFRQQYAVDAVLHVGVLVADVEFGVLGAVLIDAGRLQQHLAERSVGAAGQRLDRLAAEAVARCADVAFDRAYGAHGLRGNDDLFRRNTGRRRWRRFLRPRRAGPG